MHTASDSEYNLKTFRWPKNENYVRQKKGSHTVLEQVNVFLMTIHLNSGLRPSHHIEIAVITRFQLVKSIHVIVELIITACKMGVF